MFYNRQLALMVQKYVDLIGSVEPLDVVMYGGQNTVKATTAGAGSIAILGAPPVGFRWRLHRFVSSTANGYLTGTTSGFTFAASLGGVPDNLMGQLVNEGLTMVTSAALSGYLTYDQVIQPTIS